ncbi:MAG: hypothetical protein ACRCU2_22550 [Planktothrix sp.]
MLTTYNRPEKVRLKAYCIWLLGKKNEFMDPLEFCEKWCRLQPGEWGFKKEAIALLSEIVGCTDRAIENWGANFENSPDYARRILQREDILRDMEKLLSKDRTGN